MVYLSHVFSILHYIMFLSDMKRISFIWIPVVTWKISIIFIPSKDRIFCQPAIVSNWIMQHPKMDFEAALLFTLPSLMTPNHCNAWGTDRDWNKKQLVHEGLYSWVRYMLFAHTLSGSKPPALHITLPANCLVLNRSQVRLTSLILPRSLKKYTHQTDDTRHYPFDNKVSAVILCRSLEI